TVAVLETVEPGVGQPTTVNFSVTVVVAQEAILPTFRPAWSGLAPPAASGTAAPLTVVLPATYCRNCVDGFASVTITFVAVTLPELRTAMVCVTTAPGAALVGLTDFVMLRIVAGRIVTTTVLLLCTAVWSDCTVAVFGISVPA